MKRMLELILVAAALALTGFVGMRLLRRQASVGAPAFGGGSRAGRDEEDPRKPSAAPYVPAVKGVPMIKLTRLPRRRPLKTDVPVPAPFP